MYIVHCFSLFPVIRSQLRVTRTPTPDNSNLFSNSPEGLSYWNSTVAPLIQFVD